MTCSHVLDLIDAGPLTDDRAKHLEAARQHARECSTCGPAFDAAMRLTTALAVLPAPEPPADFSASVLAHIESIESAMAGVEAAEPAARDWPQWASALSGLAAGAVVTLSARSFGVALGGLAGLNLSGLTASMVSMPPMTVPTVAMAAGLVLYVVGLFATLGRDSRRP